MTTIPFEEFEAHLRDVLARVQAGETVVLARGGKPIAQISPCDSLAVRLEKAFPGMKHATKRMADIHIERVPLSDGSDILDVLREVQADRDLVP